MTTYYVEQLAFARGMVRPVTVREQTASIEELLEKIFYWGQNDNRMTAYYSVSVGDVAHVDGKTYLCLANGWREIKPRSLEAYRKLTNAPGFMFSPEIQNQVFAS